MISQPLEATYQQQFLTELVQSRTDVAGDILQVGATTWAIHGSVPVDTEVLVAEYDSFEAAKEALTRLAPNGTKDGTGCTAGSTSSSEASTPATPRGDSPRTCVRAVVPAYFLGRTSATWRAALATRPR